MHRLRPETTYMSTAELNKPKTPTSTEKVKPQKMIIKVPEFKRTFITAVPNRPPNVDANVMVMKEAAVSQNENNHKMSINKPYRCNPKGTPKYMCNQCKYACDTHPKMKHHLFRHKPQRYKCPYCNYRKYPRSYVVRHIRNTYRDKPMKVIDLMETGETDNDPNDSEVLNESDNMTMDISLSEDMHEPSDQENPEIPQQPRYILNGTSCGSGVTVVKNSEGSTGDTAIGHTPVCEQSNESIESKSPNASSIIRPLHSSIPITESALFDFGSTTHQSSLRKPVKNYDVDMKRKPRYICNYCHYGTENYKTIHKNMYRHKRIKFRCPYCGFKRAPRSAVEKHIRYVHKGQPIITTEVVDDEATKIITDGMNVHKRQPYITTEVVDEDATKITTDGMHVHKGHPIITTEVVDADDTKITIAGVYAHKGQPIISTDVMDDDATNITTDGTMDLSYSYTEGDSIYINVNESLESGTAEVLTSTPTTRYTVEVFGVHTNVDNQTEPAPNAKAATSNIHRNTLRCNSCTYKTYNHSNLSRHSAAVHKKRKFRCPQCNKSYVSRYYLKQHRQSAHLNIKLLCEYCSKNFSVRHTLNLHKRRVHQNKKKYLCMLCERHFLDKTHYQGHLNMHLKNRAYNCRTCKKSYLNKTNLKRYEKRCTAV